MFCSKCGKQIDDDSDFCEFCGASIKPLKSGAPTPQIDGIKANQFRENNLSASMNQSKSNFGYIKIAIICASTVICLFIVYKIVNTVLTSKDKDDRTIVVSDFKPSGKTDSSSITGVTVTGNSGNDSSTVSEKEYRYSNTDVPEEWKGVTILSGDNPWEHGSGVFMDEDGKVWKWSYSDNGGDVLELVENEDITPQAEDQGNISDNAYDVADVIEDTIRSDNSIASSMDSSSDENLPGSTRADRYDMAEYADNDDLEIFKGSDDYVRKNYGFALQSGYFEGEQILDYKAIEGGWRLISAVDGDFYDDSRYKAIRFTNCYIKTDEDNATVVFNYGVYYDASGSGANIDQTGNDPKIFHGKLAKKDKNPEYDYTYPFINMDAFTSDKDELIISQFTKAPDGREYAFGYIFWDNSNDDIEGEYIMLARP